ncbi:hypothetical protein GW916_15815 [bacterium]|nr:hypothetical protein [bacterium]
MKNALLIVLMLGLTPLASYANDDEDSMDGTEVEHTMDEEHAEPAQKKEQMKKTHAAMKAPSCDKLKGQAKTNCLKKAKH